MTKQVYTNFDRMFKICQIAFANCSFCRGRARYASKISILVFNISAYAFIVFEILFNWKFINYFTLRTNICKIRKSVRPNGLLSFNFVSQIMKNMELPEILASGSFNWEIPKPGTSLHVSFSSVQSELRPKALLKHV